MSVPPATGGLADVRGPAGIAVGRGCPRRGRRRRQSPRELPVRCVRVPGRGRGRLHVGPAAAPGARPGGLATLRGLRGRDLHGPRYGPQHARHPPHAGTLPPCLVRVDVGLRGGPEPSDRLPHRVPRRPGLPPEPGHRGAHQLLRPVRAPLAPVLRRRPCRLRPPREHHRHLQTDAAGASVRPPLYGAGAPGGRDRRHPRQGAGAARRRRPPLGDPPLHPDAGRQGGVVEDVDIVLAGQLRARAGDAGGVPPDPALQPALTLERLYEAPGLPLFDLPRRLADLYDGSLGFPATCLYANFVSSLDGVVAGAGITPGTISLRSEADRLVMGLLRASAGAVLIGAGTLRPDPGHRWTAGKIYPQAPAEFSGLRASLGLPAEPPLAVVTASGGLPSLTALTPGSLVITTPAGAKALAGSLPATAELVVPSEGDTIPA